MKQVGKALRFHKEACLGVFFKLRNRIMDRVFGFLVEGISGLLLVLCQVA